MTRDETLGAAADRARSLTARVEEISDGLESGVRTSALVSLALTADFCDLLAAANLPDDDEYDVFESVSECLSRMVASIDFFQGLGGDARSLAERESRQFHAEIDAASAGLIATIDHWLDRLRRVPSAAALVAPFWRRFTSEKIVVDAGRIKAQALDALHETERAAGATQRAAGLTSDAQLSDVFDTYARGERRIAEFLRCFVALLLLLLAAVGFEVSRDAQDQALEAADVLARLAVALPIAALAAYFAREGTRHREAARWATVLSMQLRTVDAYCQALDAAAQQTLRAEFGRRVFLAAADSSAESADAPFLAGDVAGLLQNLGSAIRGTTATPDARTEQLGEAGTSAPRR